MRIDRTHPLAAALVWGLVLAVLAALAAPGRAAAPAKSTPGAAKPRSGVPIGIKGVPAPGNSADGDMAKDLGLNFFEGTRRWADPRPGEFSWADNPDEDTFAAHLRQLKEAGYTLALTFDNIDGNQKHLPPYLAGRRLDDSGLLTHWEQYLQAFLARYGECLDYLTIGVNANEYFEKHEDEWPGFVRMVQLASVAARKQCPKLSVGVTLREEERDKYWKPLAPYCGHLAIKYFTPFTLLEKQPAALALDPRRQEFFGKTLDAALRLAAPRKLLLAEVGSATHEMLDGSPAVQAQFITALLAWIKSREAGVAGVAWVAAADLPYEDTRKALTGILDVNVLGHKAFLRFLTTLGLKTEDGTRKPGYAAFKAAIETYRRGR